MNKNIIVLPLAAMAFCLTSCNKTVELTRETAKNHVTTNYTLTETPTPKTAKVSWNFYDTAEDNARKVFQNLIKPNFKDQSILFSTSGEQDVSDTSAKGCAGGFLNATQFETIFNNNDYKFFLNGSMFIAKLDTKTDTFESNGENHYDEKGRIIYSLNHNKGTHPKLGINATFDMICTLTY